MLTICGTKECGGRAASLSLPRQISHLKKEFPEIAEIQHATINLRLEKILIVASSDHRTSPICWDENAAEVFDFVRIQLEVPQESGLISAWIYVAHRSEHRKTPTVHEIIAPPITRLTDGDVCKIHISRPCIELPYSEKAVVVVV